MPKLENRISHNELKPLDEISPDKQIRAFTSALHDENLHLHQHEDHLHLHEHYHGGEGNIEVTLIGLVIHSIADGVALGASLYRKPISYFQSPINQPLKPSSDSSSSSLSSCIKHLLLLDLVLSSSTKDSTAKREPTIFL